MSKKLLLISYTFPPTAGIGGRRWAKFAKHLANNNWNVFVITAQQEGKNNSPWAKDVEDDRIKVFYSKTGYPGVLVNGPKNFLEKLQYRFWVQILKMKNRGRIYDSTTFWKSNLVNQAITIIQKENIGNLICTIPQFTLASFAADIKKQIPQINFILDYRDPWTNNHSFHGFANISKKRLAWELVKESKAINAADWVVSTTPQMTRWNQDKTSDKNKCITIYNGFDQSDFTRRKSNQTTPKKILFAGNLYSNLTYVLQPLLESIQRIENEDPIFHEKLQFVFFGNINEEQVLMIKKFNLKSISLNGFVQQRELSNHYNDASAFMMFSVHDHGFNFNTKFFEYLSFRKPILHFSEDGDVSEFLVENDLGFGFTPAQIKSSLRIILNDIIKGEIKFNQRFDFSPFEVSSLAKEYEKILQ